MTIVKDHAAMDIVLWIKLVDVNKDGLGNFAREVNTFSLIRLYIINLSLYNLEVLKTKQDKHRSEYPHSYEDDEDDMDDSDYDEVPKSHHNKLHWLYNQCVKNIL